MTAIPSLQLCLWRGEEPDGIRVTAGGLLESLYRLGHIARYTLALLLDVGQVDHDGRVIFVGEREPSLPRGFIIAHLISRGGIQRLHSLYACLLSLSPQTYLER